MPFGDKGDSILLKWRDRLFFLKDAEIKILFFSLKRASHANYMYISIDRTTYMFRR